jgi:hypothetical protein
MDMKRINTRAELKALAAELGVRPDWHEPDERGVNALVSGHMLDNAGFWGEGGTGSVPSWAQELWVTITVKSEGVEPHGVAEVNLAMLLAWSCGYEEEPRRVTRITVSEEVAKRTVRH